MNIYLQEYIPAINNNKSILAYLRPNVESSIPNKKILSMKKLIFAEIRNNSIEYLKEQICYKNIFTELFKLTNDQIERLDHGHEIKLKCNKKTTILDFYFIEQNIYINNEKINLFNVALIEKDVFKVYYYELESYSISFYTLDSLLKFLYERFNFKIQERQLEKLNSYLMIKKFTA